MGANRVAVPANPADQEQARQFAVQVKKRLDWIDLGVLNPTSGAPADSPPFGTARFDPATNKLWVHGAAGWKSTTLT